MNLKKIIAIVLVLALVAGMFGTYMLSGKNSGENNGTQMPVSTFDHSAGLTDEGFFEGVTALDNITLPDYSAYEIPREKLQVSEDDVQRQVDMIKTNFTTTSQNKDTNRVIADGETVNISYVGTVDGVAFDGGSTGESGTEVTIGVTNYIDDFLQQIVGHKVGDKFDINVTFPEDYGNEELNGKDAVFATTINYVVEKQEPEITDDFVKENLGNFYTDVEDMYTKIREELKERQCKDWLWTTLQEEVQVNGYPQVMKDYEIAYTKDYVNQTAARYGMSTDDFATQMGFENMDEYIRSIDGEINNTVKIYLIVQGLCEQMNIRVQDSDISDYFKTFYGTEDYSTFESTYGKPYLKLVVARELVLDTLLQQINQA